jgi:hypothetical protein
MKSQTISGTEAGQRQLNGPQTTGRNYQNLSEPKYAMARQDDVQVPMRDSIILLADVFYPAEPGQYPVLVAAPPYPRQIQDLGAPLGFIEAGASDFLFLAVMYMSSPIAAAPAAREALLVSLTARSGRICMTWWNGQRHNLGQMAMSVWLVSAISR